LKNLIFFNQNGYPYNFEYDENSEKFIGKMLFDENSSDTFKTNAIYIFEEIKSFDFTENFELKNIQDYNYSGVTYVGKTYINEKITDIKKVNDGNYYSKWIFGYDFHDKFPKGSIVSFSNINFNEFDNQFFTVLDNKPNAILITSNTINSTYNSTYITGGTLSSHNFFIKKDYNSDLLTMYNNFNLDTNKRLSIVGSENNDNVYSLISSGNSYIQQDTYELNGNPGDKLKLKLTLKTERPKIYSGNININITNTSNTGTIIKFYNGLNSFLTTGQTIIFEDFNDNNIFNPNPIFTITDIIDEQEITSNDLYITRKLNKDQTLFNNFNSRHPYPINYNIDLTQHFLLDQLPEHLKSYDGFIEFSGSSTTLQKNDIIKLYKNFSGNGINNLREFKILNISGRTIKDMRIDYWKDYIIQNQFELLKADAKLKNINLERLLNIKANDLFIANDNTLNATDSTILLHVEQYTINEYNKNYTIKKQLETINTLYASQSTFSSPHTYNGNSVGYLSTNVIELEQEFLKESGITFYNTIEVFRKKYLSYLNTFGIDVYTLDKKNIIFESFYNIRNSSDKYFQTELFFNNVPASNYTRKVIDTINLELNNKLISSRTMPYDYDKLSKKFLTEILFNLSDDNNTYGFNININDADFYIEYYKVLIFIVDILVVQH